MVRRAAICALFAGLFVAPQAFAAAPIRGLTLAPGVVYSRQVEFTRARACCDSLISAPKPTGLYALKPVLSNNSILGRERVTSMQKRVSARSDRRRRQRRPLQLDGRTPDRRAHPRRRPRQRPRRLPFVCGRRHGRRRCTSSACVLREPGKDRDSAASSGSTSCRARIARRCTRARGARGRRRRTAARRRSSNHSPRRSRTRR